MDLYAALDRVAEENLRRGEPLLPALVIAKTTKLPGRGFFEKFYPETHEDAKRSACHEECIAAVRAFSWLD